MIVTVIVPTDEGLLADDIEPRVYCGKLTREQVLEATQEDGYARQAIVSYYNEKGEEQCHFVTYNNMHAE